MESRTWGSGESLPEEEGTVCALASILRAIPVVLAVDPDIAGGLSSSKLNRLEKSVAFSFPLLFGGLLLEAVPADWERMIGSGRSTRRDFTPEVSLVGNEVFLTSFAVAAIRWGQVECDVNPPGTLAGLGAVVDLCAFAVIGAVVTPRFTEIRGLR